MIYASAANLTERELYTITEAFTVTKFMPGEIIVVQGDLGNKLYIVKKVHFPKMVSNSNRNPPLLSLFSLSSLSLSLSIPSPPPCTTWFCSLCLCLKGLAVCVQQHGNEAPNQIAKLKVGSFFGEVVFSCFPYM
jgi:hypothetical protein